MPLECRAVGGSFFGCKSLLPAVVVMDHGLNIKPERLILAKGLQMRIALTIIGFTALALLAACTTVNTAPYPARNLDEAQDACNRGNGAACNAANRLRAEEYYWL